MKDNSISLVRFVATAFIVTCHIQQFTNCWAAWWFNVGVQIFLCMSGYLYGNRLTEKNSFAFIGKQFIKILVDYYVVIVIAVVLYLFFAPEYVSARNVAGVLLTYQTLPCGTHMWYIPYILFCYLLTPTFSYAFDSILSHSLKRAALEIVAVFTAVLLLCATFASFFNAAWISCYIIGFIFGKLQYKQRSDASIYIYIYIAKLGIFALAFVLNCVQILQDYVLQIEISAPLLNSSYTLFCNYAHTLLGCSLFFIMLKYFKQLNRPWLVKIGRFSDKISYDVYLVHQFFIHTESPFCLLHLTCVMAVNVAVIVFVSITAGCTVKYISDRIKSILMNTYTKANV